MYNQCGEGNDTTEENNDENIAVLEKVGGGGFWDHAYIFLHSDVLQHNSQ